MEVEVDAVEQGKVSASQTRLQISQWRIMMGISSLPPVGCGISNPYTEGEERCSIHSSLGWRICSGLDRTPMGIVLSTGNPEPSLLHIIISGVKAMGMLVFCNHKGTIYG